MATVAVSSEAPLAACASSICCIISPEMNCVSAAVSRLTVALAGEYTAPTPWDNPVESAASPGGGWDTSIATL